MANVKAPFFSTDGKSSDIELPSDIFDIELNPAVLHQAVVAGMAGQRAGTHSTKTRAEVRGGGAKPWRQKGTGRARHGSIREPQWMGGGVAHGPKPRDYGQRLNRKTKALAVRSALSDRARESKVIVIDPPTLDAPSTKQAVELLSRWGVEGKTLIVFSGPEADSHRILWKSFANLPLVLASSFATAYRVLAADTIVLTKAALDALGENKTGGSVEAPAEKTPEAKKPQADSPSGEETV